MTYLLYGRGAESRFGGMSLQSGWQDQSFALDGLAAPTVAFSMRRLLSSYVANKAITVRRASDSTTLDVGFLANGDLDAATLATFLTATTGFITTIYDQGASGLDLTQGTAANQPSYNATGINSLPAMGFVRASALVIFRTVTPAWAQPFTFSTVFMATSAAGGGIVSSNSVEAAITHPVSANVICMRAGNTPANQAAADNTAHTAGGLISAASSQLFVDGTSGGTIGIGTNAGTGFRIGTDSTFGALDGFVSEAIAWNSSQLAALATLQANQKTYWGTP